MGGQRSVDAARVWYTWSAVPIIFTSVMSHEGSRTLRPPVLEAVYAWWSGLDWDRWSFTAALALYGGAVGGFAVVANLLGRTPGFLDPVRLAGSDGFFIYASGVASGAALVVPMAYWAHGGKGIAAMGRRGLGLPQWSLLAVGYAIFFPLLIGGFFLPFALLFLSVYTGVIEPSGALYAAADTLLLSPLRGLATGAGFLFSAMWCSVFFFVGAVLMDRLDAKQRPRRVVVRWIAALALSALVIAAATLAPATLLARLG